ncbi:hypothetical protein ACIBEK_33520 [Nocardia fusca]|uniref:hypothetical protein n=1 Tax=Nocardia fusca TaxID=941183 RepID=UPI0037B7BDF5
METGKLATAIEIFETTPAAGTGDAAVGDTIEHRRRQSFLDWIAQGGLPDLTDPTGPQKRDPNVPTPDLLRRPQ